MRHLPEAVVHSRSVADTEAAGRALGAVLQPGDLLGIDGELGAGKTCLVRGLVAGLGGLAGAVRSPTFVIHQVHPEGRIPLHHMDLYRLADGADIGFLELEGLLEKGVVALEWASRADLRRFGAISLALEAADAERRLIRLDGNAPARLLSAWPPR